MRPLRTLANLVGATLLVAAVAALGRIPIGSSPTHAELRIGFRFRPPALEHCRERTPEELAALPPHMRLPRTCTWTLVPYRLAVTLDACPGLSRTLRPAGIRGDRPLSIDVALPVTPGTHTVRVYLDPSEPPAGVTAPSYALATTLTLGVGEVAYIRFEPDAGLRLHTRMAEEPVDDGIPPARGQ